MTDKPLFADRLIPCPTCDGKGDLAEVLSANHVRWKSCPQCKGYCLVRDKQGETNGDR